MRPTLSVEELRTIYTANIERATPDTLKAKPILDLGSESEITLTITKKEVEEWGLEQWLANYTKEAKVSTGGIRGPQNVLYYWDTRFPINQIGVMLATLGKALVLKEKLSGEIHKLAAGEVRYNTKAYVELISRVQAAQGIVTHLPIDRNTTAIWMVSFLIFMRDFAGGEFVTSSHAISSKTATKDLDQEGSQFLPEMSLAFVAKIEQILEHAKTNPKGYTIPLAPRYGPKIVEDIDGIGLYISYLRNSVANDYFLNIITAEGKKGWKMMFDMIGGCMAGVMKPITTALGIEHVYDWHRSDEDPFFHGIGKDMRVNPKTGTKEFFDASCDATLPEVMETMRYEESLADKPVGYVVANADPDGDRLVVGQVESADRKPVVQAMSLHSIDLGNGNIFVYYTPNHAFFLVMDFFMKGLKATGRWNDHPRFILKTTPSGSFWDKWANAVGVKSVNTPVGFKNLAAMIKKIERQLREHPEKNVVLEDIYGKKINLGVQPRIVFCGEESGGMIVGPEEMITSQGGRKALAMREKSAGEASVIFTALAAWLHGQNKLMSVYLQELYDTYGLKQTKYCREDIIYYNESESDPVKLLADKTAGEVTRDTVDRFFVSIALARRENIISQAQAREIFEEAFPTLDFSEFEDVIFVGDGTFIQFRDMFVETRKSGTDAKTRGYSCGEDLERCQRSMATILHYSGTITPKHKALIPDRLRDHAFDIMLDVYNSWMMKGL
ncbi:MAG: hypothetical protein HYV34_01215 [Candidatus Kerfeldbacteria bacterium]|nr:hypothetical protein [Candidatus Kerfeldbacteria bacterium]